MFLLIPVYRSFKVQHRNFNTSHVSINRYAARSSNISWTHFNTSHVSINRRRSFPGRCASAPISIHLMFLLIHGVKTKDGYEINFNTSHVSINLMAVFAQLDKNTNFNTSHVSINLFGNRFFQPLSVISIHLMFLLIKDSDPIHHIIELFQYISCFY